MKIILTIIAVALVIDAAGFLLWSISGQTPVDDVYVGTVTAHAIRSVTK
jgi:hypothetical protein